MRVIRLRFEPLEVRASKQVFINEPSRVLVYIYQTFIDYTHSCPYLRQCKNENQFSAVEINARHSLHGKGSIGGHFPTYKPEYFFPRLMRRFIGNLKITLFSGSENLFILFFRQVCCIRAVNSVLLDQTPEAIFTVTCRAHQGIKCISFLCCIS